MSLPEAVFFIGAAFGLGFLVGGGIIWQAEVVPMRRRENMKYRREAALIVAHLEKNLRIR